MSSKLIDTHFHLDYYKNHKEIYSLINELEQYTLCMTNAPGVYVSCKKMYQETKYLKFALGFHPNSENLSYKDFNDFLYLANSARYIGEVGLDYSNRKALPKEFQYMVFDKIVELSAEKDKVLSVHLRRSEDDAINIIKRYYPKKCIIHWFNGSNKQLAELIELNCYFSINCNMATNKRLNLKSIPKDRILVESDGPFSKVSNQKYNPTMLNETYNIIEEQLSLDNLRECVYNNFYRILT